MLGTLRIGKCMNNTNNSALHKGRQWRRIVRIEKAALLTLKGFPNDSIAMHIGIHPQTLIYLKQTPEFKSRMIALSTGIIEQHDLQIRQDEEFQREQLNEMVPLALMKLKELAMSANQHIAYKAAQDILDRQGTHAKVSRTAIDIKENVNLNVVNQVAESIMDVLRNAPTKPHEAPDQDQDSITDEFTKGATDSTSQLFLMEEQINKDTLEQIDAKRLKVN